MDNKNPRWYQTGWGVALAGVAGLIVVVVLIIAGMVGYYWWQIKHGRGQTVLSQINRLQTELQKKDPQAAERRKVLETADDPFLGNPNAQIVIVEFLDFKCSNCQTASPIINKVAQKFGNKVKIIVRDFPVESTHPGATALAEFASCANEQGKYWPVHEMLFQNQNQIDAALTDDNIASLARVSDLDIIKLKECLGVNRSHVEVNQDYADGFKYQVKGTPTFFVNGQKLVGAISYEDWEKYLNNF